MIDALVIGAGPAGSLAALLLSRAGLSVTLIEQHTFPRDKVCGECLSALGIEVLARSGLTDLPAQPIPLTRALIHATDGSSCEIALPDPMWGISRHVLDHHLLNSAKASGVRVLQPARCESFFPAITIRNLVTNQIETIESRYVLRADGKSPPDQSTGDFGIKTHFADVDGPLDAIELFAVNGSYGGLAPIEGSRWNAAFSVPAERLRGHHGNVQTRLRRARRISPWLASPLPRFGVQSDWSGGIIPIGNAAAAIEPIGGEGMGLALRSAQLAAAALIQSRRNGKPPDLHALRRDYRRLWKTRAAACRGLSLAVSCGPVARWITPAMAGCEMISNATLSLMGKTLKLGRQ
jgi:flavin-dependent dehydrogenase